MADKEKFTFDFIKAREELISLIDKFISLSNSDNLRERVKSLIPAFRNLRSLGTNIIPEGSNISGRNRILIYFQKYPLTIIDSEELLVVSGIIDYQRRIRELRVEFGWPILSGTTIKAMDDEGEWDKHLVDVSSMKPMEYLMLDSGQDRDAAIRWNFINSIRKEKLSVRDKLIKYFRQNVGREINGEELAYLAKDATEWGRRVRELRTQEGWPIKTRHTGRPELSVGVYILEEDRQAELHDRKIEDAIRVEVLTRDKFACRKCGWNYSQQKQGDPRHMLELHHLDYHVDKGANTTENLITICNVHHDYIHKNNMSRDNVFQWIESNK